MIETLRLTVGVFIPKGQRSKWVGLIALALLVAAAETVTAFLIFKVLGLATEPPVGSDSIELPLGLETTLVPLLIVAGIAFVGRGLLAMTSIYAQNRVVPVEITHRHHRHEVGPVPVFVEPPNGIVGEVLQDLHLSDG